MTGETQCDSTIAVRFQTRACGRRAARLSLVGAVLVASAGALPPTVWAQTKSGTDTDSQTPTLEEVVVTGSRLPDRNIQGANPVSIIGAQQIEELAPVSLEYELQREPDARIQGSSGGTTAGSQGDQGYVDIHHLLYNRTLVLIDGLRATPTMITSGLDTIAANISSIPLAMIDHVEILKDGASPVYGADAIGGVVNVVMKKSFDGVGGSVQMGSSYLGDRTSGSANLLAGKKWDSGDFMVGVSFSKEGLARYDGRPQYQDVVNQIGTLPNGQFGFTSTGRSITPSGIATLPSGDMYTFTAPGVYRPYSPSDNGEIDARTAIAPAVDSFSVMPSGHLQLGGGVTGYFQGLLAVQNTNYDALTLPYPLGQPIPADNPYNPFGVPVNLGRTLYPDVGYPAIKTYQNTYRMVAGVEGSFLDSQFDWKLDYVWGRTRDKVLHTDDWNTQKLANALDPTLCAAAPGCVVADLFGPGTLSPAAANYFLLTDVNRDGYDQRIVEGSVDGRLFELPGGSATAAVGFEHRTDAGYTWVNIEQQEGISSMGQAEDTDGSYSTTEAYTELGLPILKDEVLARTLAADLAARFSHYSDFGNTTNWKAGLNWAPVEDIRFRANRASGFRAPNIAELYGGASTNLQAGVTSQDPCSAASVAANPIYRAGCAAAGVPAGYVPPAGQGTAVVSSGNPNIKPETSQSTNVGVVLTPHWVPRLALSLDYYRVHLFDAISAPDPVYILQQCYASGASLSSPYCSMVSRNADGTLNKILDVYVNTGGIRTDGFDLGASYDIHTADLGLQDPGTLGFDVRGNYVRNYLLQTVSGGPVEQLAGRLNLGPDVGSLPRLKMNITASYSRPAWRAGWAIRVIGPGRLQDAAIASVGGPDPYDHTPTVLYHDVFAQAHVGPVGLTAGVQNLFNRQAPFTFPGPSYDFGLYDPIGRYFYLKASFGL
jgi:iron complex outermembrane recepter protein